MERSQQKAAKLQPLIFVMCNHLSTCNNPGTMEQMLMELKPGSFTKFCWQTPVIVKTGQKQHSHEHLHVVMCASWAHLTKYVPQQNM